MFYGHWVDVRKGKTMIASGIWIEISILRVTSITHYLYLYGGGGEGEAIKAV